MSDSLEALPICPRCNGKGRNASGIWLISCSRCEGTGREGGKRVKEKSGAYLQELEELLASHPEYFQWPSTCTIVYDGKTMIFMQGELAILPPEIEADKPEIVERKGE